MNLAAQGVRNLDEGVERIRDEMVNAELRKQALKVYAYSIAFGLLLTVPFVLL